MANIIVPRRREDFFKDNGDPTLRFTRWMEGVTDANNTSTVTISETQSGEFLSAHLQQVIKELAGLPEFTMDKVIA